MKQRGRKSTSTLATVTQLPQRMLEAPAELSAEEAAVWAQVAATKPNDWWDAGSTPLLAQYCRAAVQSDLVAELVRTVSEALRKDPDELDRYKDLRKLQAGLSAEMTSLATKMRLTQQARYVAKGAATAAAKVAPGRKPWHSPVVAEQR